MVEMFGLNRPLPTMIVARPSLKIVLVRHRDHEQAGRHDHRAEQDRALVAEDLVGDVAAEDRARRTPARGRRRRSRLAGASPGGVAAVELRHDVQHQRPADAVEREALPELGHEQHPQRTRMAHDLLEFRNRARRGVGGSAHAVSPRVEYWNGVSNATCTRHAEPGEHRRPARRPRQTARIQDNVLRCSIGRRRSPLGSAPRPGPIEVRTSNSSGKKVRSSAA